MSVKVEEGFCQAQSDNLPKINALMVAEFFSNNDCFSASEIRGVKEASAGRESYGDSAIGYVQVRREDFMCIVKCRICPEHRVRSKNYNVVLEVNEKINKVQKVMCLDCAASAGGCKHAVAFLMWVHRRSEQPAPTEVACYWKKSQLSKVGTSLKFVTVEAFGGKPIERPQNSFFEQAVNLGIQKNAGGEIFKLFKVPKYNCLSLYLLMLQFAENNGSQYEDFRKFCQQQMDESICQEAAFSTLMQAEESLWHQLRFGRITASKLYNAAHCRTKEGSFVQQAIGVAKLRDTKAMERGRRLEKEVQAVLEKKINCKFTSIGIMLSKQHPIFGASPDGIFEDSVIEIKCPFSNKSFSNYITASGTITAKYKAQVQLQMHILNLKKCIFCVADSNFEINKKITDLSITYDERYIKQIMADAENFWKQNIFPVLLASAKK